MNVEATSDLAVVVLREHRCVPDGIIDAEPNKPAEDEIEIGVFSSAALSERTEESA